MFGCMFAAIFIYLIFFLLLYDIHLLSYLAASVSDELLCAVGHRLQS